MVPHGLCRPVQCVLWLEHLSKILQWALKVKQCGYALVPMQGHFCCSLYAAKPSICTDAMFYPLLLWRYAIQKQSQSAPHGCPNLSITFGIFHHFFPPLDLHFLTTNEIFGSSPKAVVWISSNSSTDKLNKYHGSFSPFDALLAYRYPWSSGSGPRLWVSGRGFGSHPGDQYVHTGKSQSLWDRVVG